MGFHEAARDRQAESHATGVAGARGIEPGEPVEHAVAFVRRQTGPLVLHVQPVGLQTHPHARAGMGVAQGVVQQVVQDLAQP